jgi:serine protease Do
MANSDTLAIGDHALVVGHPFAEDNSLTVGVVSQLNRFEGIDYEDGERWIANLIQFDAPANFGNSGGPVFNADGEVIGMVIAGVSPLFGEGISFAVSSNKLDLVAHRFFDIRADDPTETPLGEYYGRALGIVATDISPAKAEAAGRTTVFGALVEEVVSGPPEGNVLHVGDIIVAIGDYTIRDVGDLASHVCFLTGDEMVIRVIRNGVEIELTQQPMGLADEFWLHKEPAGKWF